jgi:hypothetical protein
MWESSFIAGDESDGDECCRCVSVAPVRSSVHSPVPASGGLVIDGRQVRKFNPQQNFSGHLRELAL